MDVEKNQSSVRDHCRGKFQQGRRMVAYCGKEVMDLQRLTMGTLTLMYLNGEWRRLTKEELEACLSVS